jgi:hypothetical protein
MEKESRERTMARLEELPEFKEGEEEFIEAIDECPACSVKLALELVDSEDPNDKAVLKKVLAGLGETLLKMENKKHSKPILRLVDEKRFPILSGWLRGEVGLGIVAKILEE